MSSNTAKQSAPAGVSSQTEWTRVIASCRFMCKSNMLKENSNDLIKVVLRDTPANCS